ncbi:MAG: hemolysin family protein [Pseudomonadota bacterium]
MTLLIIFFSVSLIFSFLCSMWEAVLLSITPTYAEIQRSEGTVLGRLLSEFKQDIDRPLSAILTLNTIAHTVGAIGVGAQAAKIWATSPAWITQLAVPAIMTLAILVFSEIIPKTLGAVHWKSLAPFTVRCLQLIIAVFAPLVWFSRLITGLFKGDEKGSLLTRSDFVAMAQLGAQTGVFEENESEIIRNLLRFERVRAADIMTPRTVVVGADATTTLQQFYDAHPSLRFSRIPVFQGASRDLVTGFFLKDDLLDSLLKENGNESVDSLRRPIMVIPRDFPLPDLFGRLVEKREHIAVVVDEYGGMAGVVTMEDVIETLLGLEIVDESDHAEDMQTHARATWRARAKAHGLAVEDVDTPDAPANASNVASATTESGDG